MLGVLHISTHVYTCYTIIEEGAGGVGMTFQLSVFLLIDYLNQNPFMQLNETLSKYVI